MKILAVDDHPLMREAFQDIIEETGYQVHLENSGNKAFEYLSQNQVDAIVTDYRMPDGDGLELIRKARKVFQGPIILASTDDRIEQKALEAGATRFLDKKEIPLFK